VGRGSALCRVARIVLSSAAMTDAASALEAEARLFSRYLVGTRPAPEIVARYCDASGTLWPAGPGPRDAARLAFVRRHPWSLGPLDAAAALLDPGGQLRGRVLVASAILETTTAHADDFLPRTVPAPMLLWRLIACGAVAVAQAVAGVALWPVAGRART
jgi:hypothetical protein